MTRRTFSILFLIKRNKLNKKGEVPIYMRITVDRERSETTIKRSIPDEYWDSDRSKAKRGYKYYKQLNAYMDQIRNQVFSHQQDIERNNKIVTAKSLMNRYLGRDEENRTILDIYKEHNNKMYKRIGAGAAEGTYKRHLTSKDHLERFIRQEYKVSDMYLNEITPEFVEKYEEYFRVDRRCGNNTTAKYLRNFGKIINWAIKNEWLSTNPLRNLKLKIEPVDKEFLTEDELERIKSKRITIERISSVRDIFVFCCYTGLAYIDVYSLTYKDIETGPNGSLRLRIKRKKTGTVAYIPLLPQAMVIIDKYRDHPVCRIKNTVLPVLSNQKMNGYLKEVADLCGIEKNLTTHCARHTFATTVTLANNIPMEVVSKMLGHTNLNITKQYARILDKTIDNEMDQLARKLSAS